MKYFLGLGIATTVTAISLDDIAREALVREINSAPGVLWNAAPNPSLKGLPVDYCPKSMCGVKPSPPELLAKAKRAPKVNAVIPDSFDSATNWPQCKKVITDIRDQSACGCCWAFAAASAASDRLCIATNGTMAFPLSAQNMCFCAEEDGCQGGSILSPWYYLTDHGLVTGGNQNATGAFGGGWCSEFSLPHCHHHGPTRNDPYPDEGTSSCPIVQEGDSPSCPAKCDSSAIFPHSDFASDHYGFDGDVTNYGGDGADAIAQAIMEHGPVETAFTVYADFANYASGIYHHVTGTAMGGHAVKIVGWGIENATKYWKVQNSWNPYWGENGYFRIKRGNNECGIEDQVTANSPNSKWKKMKAT